jgi:parallel beta-helix repeat protein
VFFPIQMNGSASGGFPPYTWLWDFGDGDWDWEQEIVQNPMHYYSQPGRYNVTLNVTDRLGNFHVQNTTVIIQNYSPYIRVDDDFNENTTGWGYDHFNTLEDGITAVAPYGTVSVAPGTYGATGVGKSVTIIGDDATQTIINGFQNYHYSNACVYISAEDVTVSGFTMRNCSQASVIILYASNIRITGNYLEGITLDHSFNDTIRDNTFLAGGIIFAGEDQECSFWNSHTIENNVLLEKQIYYYKNSHEPLRVPSDAGQVILANCSQVTMDNLTLEGGWTGVQIGFSSNNTLSNSSISVAMTGQLELNAVDLISSEYNTLIGNRISSASQGLQLIDSIQNIIRKNTIEMNYDGMYFVNSNGNSILENIIRENSYGIFMVNSNDILVVGNNFISNYDTGLWLYSGHPVSVYHNNFIDNGQGAYNYGTYTWDNGYPSGGNYWSDDPYKIDNFHGPNQNLTGSDGIDDSGFMFNSGRDRYPFMNIDGWL